MTKTVTKISYCSNFIIDVSDPSLHKMCDDLPRTMLNS